MNHKPLSQLRIRTGVVRQPDTGYLLACDPEMEEAGIAHAYPFTWKAGKFESGSLNFNAHTTCLVSSPGLGWVMLAAFGEFGVTTPRDRFSGNIFAGQDKRKTYGVFRVVSQIAGRAYAAGHGGIVYRLDEFVRWTRIDEGLPSNFKIVAIDGFDDFNIYAAGYDGVLWYFNGHTWSKIEVPTNVNLTAVKCAGDGHIYAAGYNGTIVRGNGETWEVIADDATSQTIWDLEWFEGCLYLSTVRFLYRLRDEKLELVLFDGDSPESCYHLSAAKGVLWSIGGSDVMSYDGSEWSRIV